MLCTSKGPHRGGGNREEKCIWNNKTPRQINSTAFPWQHGAVIWRLVSHGCVSLPHRPPLCLTDGSCDCNHPSYCQRQEKKKKGKKGEIAHTISLSLPCVQQTSHPTVSRANTWTTGPLHWVCVCVCVCPCLYDLQREHVWVCIFGCLCLPIILHDQSLECTRGSGGHVWSCSWSKAPETCSLVAVQAGLISTCLCSVDRKNKRRETGKGGGGGEGGGGGGTSGERQKQAGKAQMKECIRGQSVIYDNDT